jgi:hypothetical protein
MKYRAGLWLSMRSLLITHSVPDNPAQNVFMEVLDPLEKYGAPLDTTWGLVKTLYLTNKDLMPVRAYVNIHDKARRSRALKFNSEPIYAACKGKYLSWVVSSPLCDPVLV